MKKPFRYFLSFLTVAFLSLGLYSFTIYQQTKSKLAVLKQFLYEGGFFASKYSVIMENKEWMLDSSVYTKYSFSWDTGRYYYISPMKVDVTPATISKQLFDAISSKDSEGNYLDYNESFKKIFGLDVRKYPKHEDYRHINNASYKADALLQAFTSIYKKPNESIDGMVMSKIYNISFKEYARACADIIVEVTKNKTVFEQQAVKYKQLAQTGKLEDGQTFCYEASLAILGKDFYETKMKAGTKKMLDNAYDRIVGIMLRRQMDGSLPTVISCVKRVLKDYDPSFYETIKNKF